MQQFMIELTELIKSEIKNNYKSVRDFCLENDIPYTTLANALKNGVSHSAFALIARVCTLLEIKIVNYNYPLLLNEEIIRLINQYKVLDEKGSHTVKSVLAAEYRRCTEKEHFEGHAAAFGGQTKEIRIRKRNQRLVKEALQDIKLKEQPGNE